MRTRAALAAAGVLALSVTIAGVDRREDRQQTAATTQEAEQAAERAAMDAEQDAWFAAEMARHERAMKRVNARADRVLQREAERLGVPVDSIDPRITGDWSRWTYQPDGKPVAQEG